MLIILGLVALATGTCTLASTQTAHPPAETQGVRPKGQIHIRRFLVLIGQDLVLEIVVDQTWDV